MAQDVGTVYVQVEPSGRGFGRKIEGDLGDSIDKVSDRGSKSLFSRLGGAFTKVGKAGLTTIGALTGGIVGLAAKGGFERALAIENAQAKLKGLGHSVDDVTEIMNDAMAAVKGTAFGLGDAATVAASLSASGVASGEQMTKVLKTVADTAQISGRSLTDIGTIFGSVAARGKLQGDDMLQLMSSGIPVLQLLGKHLGKTSAEVSDMVSKGKIDFQTFADAMQEGLGGAALSAGTTFQGALANVKAALSRMGETLGKPVLDGLRGLFNQAIPLIDNFTASAKPTMESVGASLQQGIENAIPTLQSLAGRVGGYLAPLSAPIANLKKQLVSTFSQISEGSADMGKSIESVIQGIVSNVKTGIDLVSSVIGKFNEFAKISDLAGLAAKAVQLLGDALKWGGDNGHWLLPLATGIAGVVAAGKGLAIISSGLGKLAGAAGTVASTATGIARTVDTMKQLGGVLPALKQLASGMGLVKNAQLAWSAVTKAASAVQLAFNAVLSANPIGILVLAIGAVVAALALFFTKTEAGRKIWAGFTDWVKSSWQSVTGFFSDSWDTITGVFDSALDKVKSVWDGVSGWFSDLWDSLSSTVSTKWQAVYSWLVEAMQGVQGFIGNVWTVIGALILRPLQLVRDGINAVFGWMTGFISSQMDQTSGVVHSVWTGIYAIVQTVWTMISGVVSTAVNAVRTVIVAVLQLIKGDWSGAWETVSSFFTAIWQGIVDFFALAIHSIQAMIDTVLSYVSTAWNNAWGAINGFFSGVWNNMLAFLAPVVDSIQTTIGNTLSLISTTWNNAWGAINGFFSGIWQGMVNTVGQKVAEVGDKVAGIRNLVTGKLSDAGNWLLDAGKQVVSGLINGIKSKFEDLKKSITDMGNKAVGWAKGALDIHSPSRVFRDQVGVMIGRGMAEGIEDSRRFVNRSMDRIAKGLTLDGMSIGTPAVSMLSKGLMGNSGQAALRDNGGPPITMNVSTMDPMSAAREATRLVAFSMGG
ncbi:tape measure protein [uncultured Bifidobacterium sp.]|uniref:phage tail protein n=1 Tax=uncultured Bifidobacterium sp. TaxID=165187 RepID=UPI002615722A|nr:tape measure protein [uncultured Bifidobacterium sp.]